MKNLKASGLSLRTIKPKQYSDLIEDINFNFLQLLNLPGFRGREGQSIEGPPGPSTRGSKWCFARFEEFSKVYPLITSADEINLQFLNISFAENPIKLFSAIYIPNDTEMIIGDLIVLQSGQIVELIQNKITSQIEFSDTGITFAQVTQITEQQIIDLINRIVQPSVSNDSFRHFVALGKNASDESQVINDSLTQTSVLDIQTSTSGPGYPLEQTTVIAPTEMNVGSLTKLMLIAGSVNNYHRLVQGTQKTLTNEYAPLHTNIPALTVLQNNFNNGILIGNKSDINFRKFSRIYRNEDSLIITSSYSPLKNEYSEVSISDTELLIRAASIIKVVSKEMIIETEKFKSRHLESNIDQLTLGKETTKEVQLYGKAIKIKSDKIPSGKPYLLGVEPSGEISAKYLVLETFPESGATNQQIITAKGIYDVIADIKSSQNNIDKSSLFKSVKRIKTDTVALSSFEEIGIYALGPGVRITDLPDGVSQMTTTRSADIFLLVYRTDDTELVSSTWRSGFMQELLFPKNIIPDNLVRDTFQSNDSANRVPDAGGEGQITYQFVYERYVRTGLKRPPDKLTLGQVEWTGTWTKFLNSNDKPIIKAGLTSVGSYNLGTYEIKHAAKKSTLKDIINPSVTVLQSMRFDEYGHPTLINSIDLSNYFINRTEFLKEFMYGTNQKLSEFFDNFQKMNRQKVITSGLFVIGDSANNGAWHTCDGSAETNIYRWHNLGVGNRAKYKLERLSNTQSLVYVKIDFVPGRDPSGFSSEINETSEVNFDKYYIDASIMKSDESNTLNSLKTNMTWLNTSRTFHVQRLITSDYPVRKDSLNRPITEAVFLVSNDEQSSQQVALVFKLNRYVSTPSERVGPMY